MEFEILKLCNEYERLADEYKSARIKSSHFKHDLDVILAANADQIRKLKKNAGIDVMYLMLIELVPDTKNIYEGWKKNEAKYKALERVLDAVKEKINVQKLIIKSDGSIT